MIRSAPAPLGEPINWGARSMSALTLTAGENISSSHAVVCHDGLAYNADASDADDAGYVVGLAVTSALAGNQVSIQSSGEIDNAGWAFTPGTPIFLDSGGGLAERATGTAFDQQIGVALSATRLFINLGDPILSAD